MSASLLIFDMDGTLVDSETCAAQAILDVVPDYDESVASVMLRYRGQRLQSIFDDIDARHPGSVPEDAISLYRQRESVLATTLIQACPGVHDMLEQLPHDCCVASNAPREKTLRSLKLCQLDGYFAERVYSAYSVNAWKPEPALFLHAAMDMGYSPERCIVVEDSDVGIRAALAAGMQAVRYDPHLQHACIADELLIRELPELIDLLHANKSRP